MASQGVLDLQLIGHHLNYYPDKRSWALPCKKTSTVQNVQVDLWDGPTNVYVPPATARQLEVVSSDAGDTLAGIGAHSIHLHYLDGDYLEHDIVIDLDGLNPVLTAPLDILRLNNYHVTAGAKPIGTISIRDVGGLGLTYGIIAATHNFGRPPMFTIPAGRVGYIAQWSASCNSANGSHATNIDLRADVHEGVRYPGIFMYQDGYGLQNGAASIHFLAPIKIPEKSDIKVSALSDAANANVTAFATIRGWHESV